MTPVCTRKMVLRSFRFRDTLVTPFGAPQLVQEEAEDRSAKGLFLSLHQVRAWVVIVRIERSQSDFVGALSVLMRYDLFDEGEMDIQDVLKLLQAT